jgi:hypothetical protein
MNVMLQYKLQYTNITCYLLHVKSLYNLLKEVILFIFNCVFYLVTK